MATVWKENWDETRDNFSNWWNHRGLLAGSWSPSPRNVNRAGIREPSPPESIEQRYLDIEARIDRNHYAMSRCGFPLDTLPKPDTDFGPGSLATFLGSEPRITKETVWFEPTMASVETPETLPPLIFDPNSTWFRHMSDFLAGSVNRADGAYMIGIPDLIENVDILAALRGNQTVLMDMIERPAWILDKLLEINHVYFNAYEALYEIVKGDDGSSVFCAFGLWGPGKTAKVQCDASAMFSPAMFRQFVVPALTEQCEWLDNSMFHLDGHQCIPHLDHLLEIDALDAIEWTPDPGVPSGGDPEWYPMYRRILAAGKSVQAIGVRHDQIAPLIDAVGSDGLYIMTDLRTEEAVESVSKIIEPYR